MRRWSGLATLSIAMVLGAVSTARAQETPPPGTMGIWIPDPAELGAPGFSIVDETGGLLAAFVDGTFCDSFVLDDPMLLVIGAVGQPDACRTEGGRVTFASGRGLMMTFSSTYAADEVAVFNNYAPWPPHTPYPSTVCDFFGSAGIESTSCRMIGPPGPSEGGNAGLARNEPSSQMSVGILVGAVVLAVVGARYGVGRRAA